MSDDLTPAKIVWQPLPGSQAAAISCPCNELLYEGSRGPGKCLPIETPVPTPNGWKPHGDLKAGDSVFGSNGETILIAESYQKESRECFKLTLNDGSTIEASDNHLWKASFTRFSNKVWRVVETSEMFKRISEGLPIRLPERPLIEYPFKPLPMDAYMLGLWMGDGSASVRIRKPTGNRTKDRNGYCVEFGSMDSELVSHALACGFSIKRRAKGFTWLTGKEVHKNALFSLGLFGTKSDSKFIPSEILLNDVSTRIAFLQGLGDTDGTVNATGGCRITTVSKQLANDTASLIRSLGGFVRIGTYTPKESHRQKLAIYNIDFSFKEIIPFKLERKTKNLTKRERLGWFLPKILKIEHIGIKKVSCVRVDAEDSLYCVGSDYLITHNTDCQVMAFRRFVGKGYGKHWRGVIFDRQYSSLDDLIAKSKLWFPQFEDGAKFLSSKGDLKWVWPTGEELLFRQITKESDYQKYHGHQYPFMGWNELTKFANSKVYDLMKSCNRSGFLPEEHTPFELLEDGTKKWLTEDGKILPDIPLMIFSTTNPIGPGHAWVKKRFIDVAEAGEVVKEVTNVFNPRTQQREEVVRTQVRLFGSYKENKYLDPIYVASLENEKDENRRKAWLHGDWNIVAGGAIDDLWKANIHVIAPFQVPKHWIVDRSFDWGSTHPASVGWWCEATGEELELSNGQIFAPRPGSLIRFQEWYIAKRDSVNEGLKLSGGDIAEGILEREMEFLKKKTILTVPRAGPADNQIFQNPQSDVKSIADKMAEVGVKWTKSDKSNGSRINGLQLLRDRLEASIRGEGPGIYFTSNCKNAISLLPVLPRDPDKPDDVDTLAEDHLYDEVRYRVLDSARKLTVSLKTNYSH